MFYDPEGAQIAVDLYEIPTAKLGDFLGNIPQPLGLGEITLYDGRKVLGFLCDKYSAEQGRDLTGEVAFVLSI